jgi:hypothetical protein
MRSLLRDGGYRLWGLVGLLAATPALAQAPVEVDWQRPGVDFSRYASFLIEPLDLSDVKLLKPSWEQDDPEEWTLRPGTDEAIQEIFMNVMVKTISGDDGYPVVDEPGHDVLQLEVEFLSITPHTKPGAAEQDTTNAISTLGSGDVVVSAELRDSVTGSLLVLVEGERQIGTEYKTLSRESHVENLEATFRLWGSSLRGWMDEHRSP